MTKPIDASPNLQHAKNLATLILVITAVLWIVLMILAKVFPAYAWLLHILILSAEAGVVGGLADWYAITVLFRNPFGRLPLPKLLRDHTEIIPRNKARIAESMGRFVQENFLSPEIVSKSLREIDLSLAFGQWLQQQQNSQKVVDVVQLGLPKILDFMGQQQISQFVQDNSIQWLKNTKINQLVSQMLHAILNNDFHQDVLQHGLDFVHTWLKSHPEDAYMLTEKIFAEFGMLKLVKGVNWIGIDVQKKAIDSFLSRIENMLAEPEHPWRQQIEAFAEELMQSLADDDSFASERLNHSKNQLLDSPQLINFIGSAVAILCDAIKQDLSQIDSGIASNLNVAIIRLGKNIVHNDAVRQVFNQRILSIATELSHEYSDKIIRFISARIHEWDSREMIEKIETEVGGDLHMIRVNGVVVGAFIGLMLGLIRAGIDYFF